MKKQWTNTIFDREIYKGYEINFYPNEYIGDPDNPCVTICWKKKQDINNTEYEMVKLELCKDATQKEALAFAMEYIDRINSELGYLIYPNPQNNV